MSSLRCFCGRCDGDVTYTHLSEFLDAHPGEHQFAVIEHTQIRKNRARPNTAQLQLFDWGEQGDPL